MAPEDGRNDDYQNESLARHLEAARNTIKPFSDEICTKTALFGEDYYLRLCKKFCQSIDRLKKITAFSDSEWDQLFVLVSYGTLRSDIALHRGYLQYQEHPELNGAELTTRDMDGRDS
jgi:hypothetical protein